MMSIGQYVRILLPFAEQGTDKEKDPNPTMTRPQ